jgi:hypothetical protein
MKNKFHKKVKPFNWFTHINEEEIGRILPIVLLQKNIWHKALKQARNE